jgi:hypothetical protein
MCKKSNKVSLVSASILARSCKEKRQKHQRETKEQLPRKIVIMFALAFTTPAINHKVKCQERAENVSAINSFSLLAQAGIACLLALTVLLMKNLEIYCTFLARQRLQGEV